ncbi:MAG: helix-turn-helix domain-containing protein [Pseudomonadota bacterium]|nr:helix-turn-helix domain-containing protein [Pseudomonadota bacterium]
MLFTSADLLTLARHLTVERKLQGLTRAQAAAVCNVSPSFIRDAESDPAACSLGRLLQYMAGLGLSMNVAGWSHDVQAQIDFSDDVSDAESRKS